MATYFLVRGIEGSISWYDVSGKEQNNDAFDQMVLVTRQSCFRRECWIRSQWISCVLSRSPYIGCGETCLRPASFIEA